MAKPTNEKPAQLGSAFELFTKSKDLVIKNINVFGILYALPLLFTILGSIDRKTAGDTADASMFGGFSRASTAGLIGFGAAIAAITVVVSIVVQIMIVIAELQVSAGKKPTISELWEVTKKYGLRLIGLGIVVGLMFVGGLILLIVPAFFVLRRYFLSPYYLIDRDLSISEAMRQSALDSKPYASEIWSVIGVTVLLSLTAIIPLIGSILSFVLVALYSVAAPLRYQEIKRLSSAQDIK